MPNLIELHIENVLKGLPLEDENSELCDFTLAEQNAALEAQGVEPSIKSDYVPIVGKTVTYVVATVLINEQNEVLMMQEAKQTCAGKWYLPAGRVDPGESLCEAAEREVLEETGLIVKCTTLLMVESASGSWIRFVMTGDVKGGDLKTPAQADQESLQAKWIADLNELSLRATDIVHLIDRAKLYKAARRNLESGWHSDLLPSFKSHSQLLLRLLIVIKKRSNNKVHVLVSERTGRHLPACQIHPIKSVHSTLRRFMVELFGAEVPQHRPHGILSVEHDGKSKQDGVCLTLLVAFRPPLEEVSIIGKCIWLEVPKDLGDHLIMRTSSRNSTFPLHVIR